MYIYIVIVFECLSSSPTLGPCISGKIPHRSQYAKRRGTLHIYSNSCVHWVTTSLCEQYASNDNKLASVTYIE